MAYSCGSGNLGCIKLIKVSWSEGSRLNIRSSFSWRYEILFVAKASLRCISAGIIVKEVSLNLGIFLES